MRKTLLVLPVLMCLTMCAPSPAAAAEKNSDGFFGFKKFIKKHTASEKSRKAAVSGELTDEEKKLVKEMAAKVPSNNGPGLGKADVKVPARILAAAPPKGPTVLVPGTPPKPPRNPNAYVIRPPKPPSRAPQVPQTAGPEAPTGNKKP